MKDNNIVHNVQVDVYEAAYLRYEMTFTRNEISFHRKKSLLTLLFSADEMKWSFFSGVVAIKRPLKICKQTRVRYRDMHVESDNAGTY